MTKSFSRAPKPQQLSAEVITAFERNGVGQDTRGRIPTIVENRVPTDVGNAGVASETTNVGSRKPTFVEKGKDPNVGVGVAAKMGRDERMRRLSIDLPESWHRRFKIACTRADKKMIDEVTEFIKRRTVELENE